MCDDQSLRLFVAWRLPDDNDGRAHSDAIVQLQHNIDEVIPPLCARWEPPEKLHITLRFIGEFPCDRYDELVEALSVPLSGQTSFPVNFDSVLLHFGRMIWLEPNLNLHLIEELHNTVDHALTPFELRPGLRFAPHITLARLRHNAPSRIIAGHKSPFRYPHLPPVQLSRISLMSSQFHSTGSSYRVEHEIKLLSTQIAVKPVEQAIEAH